MTNLLNMQIRQMIWNFPTLFGNRSKCLEHLFCVNGNGYEWVDGIIQSDDDYERNPDCVFQDEEKELALHIKDYDLICLKDKYRKIEEARVLTRVRKHNLKMKFRRENADLLALVNKPLPYIYPLCEYALMATVPDNIHPDYLEGVKEMIFIIFSTPFISYTQNPYNPYSESKQKYNIEFASNILFNLSKRFGKGNEKEPTTYQEYAENQQKIIEEMKELWKQS